MSKKSRKLIRSGAAAQPIQPQSQPVAEAVPRTFFFLPDAAAEPVDERDLHQLMKLWRHGRATRTIGQVISDGYVTLFSIALVGAMITSTVLSTQHGMTSCDTDACNAGRLLLPTVVLFGSYALTIALALLFGPVLASSAEGSWLMDAPIRRERLLRSRMTVPLLIAVVVPVLVTGLVGALAGLDWVSVAAWAVASGLGSAALLAFAALEQTRERTVVLRILQTVWSVAALAIGLVLISLATGWLSAAVTAPESQLRPALFALAAAAAVFTVGVMVVVLRRLDRIRRARLMSGGSLVSGMQGAMFALDMGLIRDILVERKAAEKGHVRPTKGRGLGTTALVWRDVERLGRSPGVFVGWAMSLLVPYAVDALRLSQLNPLISGLALTAALVPFLGSLRVLSRTGGLARALPFKTTEIRTAAMAVPAVLALVWAAIASPAFVGITSTGSDRSVFDGVATAAVTGLAGLFGAVRWVTAGKPDYSAPMMATASGAMPPTLIFNLFRGIDMVALITAPVILGADATWSLALAVVVFIGLRGTFNLDQLRAEQEAAQAELKATRDRRPEKTKVPAPKR